MNAVMQAILMFVATVSMVTTGIIPAVAGEGTALHSIVRIHEVSSPSAHNGPAARGKRLIYPDQIREAIHGFVLREIAGKAVDCQVALGEPQQPIAVPSGTLDLQVSASRSDEPLGRRVFQIHLAVNGRYIKTLDATADVAAVQEVVVPVRPIKMDEQIESADVTIDRIVLFDLKQPYITNPADAIGKAAIRPLAAQSAIRITALRRPFAVHKGDRVTIEARQGNLSIQTVGITKSHGEMGQTITVSNVDSGKELRATVVAPGVVRVTF
ncbi:MAG: putative Flagella basal body P-ring formation protein FlgA [Nitrospira sp.]|jgi:flagella basal body P-ring formation protein FlgA|nr:putative Flagella basal body P-ring formation protein FlgA [Nitrospira sp.]